MFFTQESIRQDKVTTLSKVLENKSSCYHIKFLDLQLIFGLDITMCYVYMYIDNRLIQCFD